MKLKKFDNKLPEKKKPMKQTVAVLCICLIAVISFTSYAIFKVQRGESFVKSKVGDFSKADIVLTIMVDGEESDVFPSKDEGKVYEKIECTEGNAEWDEENQEVSILNISGPTECTISFIAKSEEYADASGAEAPVLNNGLIPVIHDGTNWVKADIIKKWYDYDNQWWANAVTVTSSTRETYTNASANTPINMEDIETMWVWIPRYEYQHTNLGEQYAGGIKAQPGPITINFISKDVITPSSDNFTIHDAFKWDNRQLSGIWVAKFEMSTGASDCTIGNGNVETGCDLATRTPQIKPDVTSWRGARIGTYWTAIHNNMNGESNTYGLSNSDAHLMKNMEWGGVAYLSQSKYGKYGNDAYEGADKEVAINNCGKYITGIGGDTVSAASSSETCTTNTYETEKGQAASTTGNIYGIYDMSGGAHEYVMGVQATEAEPLEPIVGNTIDSNSGWSGKLYDSDNWTEYTGEYESLKDIGSKYYDLYVFGKSQADVSRYHKGDATFETKSWYSDQTYFVNLGSSFFYRGGFESNARNAGVFCMYRSTGNFSVFISGRPVLVQTN